jgi:hypothetical protein
MFDPGPSVGSAIHRPAAHALTDVDVVAAMPESKQSAVAMARRFHPYLTS